MNRRAALSAYIDEMTREPFQYGVSDCLLTVAGAVHRLTGIDHAAPYRGRYRTLTGGKRLIGKSLLAFVAETFAELEHQSRAVDGDIGAVKQGREWTFGIFVGPYLYVRTADGMGILPRSDATRAFRVI